METDTVSERAGLMFLYLMNLCVSFPRFYAGFMLIHCRSFMFAGSFAHLTVVTAETAEAAGNLCNLLFSLVRIQPQVRTCR